MEGDFRSRNGRWSEGKWEVKYKVKDMAAEY